MEETSFGKIVAEAARIKGAQSSARRKRFESWPVLLQQTAFMGQEQPDNRIHSIIENEGEIFEELRALPYKKRLMVARRMKTEGTEYFRKGDYHLAMNQYARAAGLFYYARILNPNWRSEGLNDDYIEIISDIGESEEEQSLIKDLRVQCYSNIAMCQMKLGTDMLPEARRTCDVVLELDKCNVKALYRRAKCLILPPSSGAEEVESAIRDLSKAQEIEPDNSEVSALLRELRSERLNQRRNEKKTYSGWCNRGTLLTSDEDVQINESVSVPLETVTEVSELHTAVEARLKEAQLLRDIYQNNGEIENAKSMNEYIKKLRRKEKQYTQSCETQEDSKPFLLSDIDKVDDSVCKEVKERFGLDITDPIVFEELKRFDYLKETGALRTTEEVDMAAKECARTIQHRMSQRRVQECVEEMENFREETENSLRQRHPCDLCSFRECCSTSTSRASSICEHVLATAVRAWVHLHAYDSLQSTIRDISKNTKDCLYGHHGGGIRTVVELGHYRQNIPAWC